MARFMRKGITKVWFAPTVASLTAPTVAEVVTNGDPITGQIAEINGFEFTNNPITVPDLVKTFDAQIGGSDSAADSNMVFYELRGETDAIRTLLAKGTSGFVVIFAAGTAGANPAAADKCEVWPVQITSNSRMYTVDNEAAKYRVAFSILDEPEQDAIVAA